MAIITGVTSQFIPTIGTYLGILIPALFALFNEPVSAIYILIFATIYQQFENYVISPRISKMTMDIHPAIAFGSVIVFANLFGAMGAVVSIPIAAALVSIIGTYGQRYELIPALREAKEHEALVE
jgi:predicted PurR-regulated permease PerM